MKSLLMLIAILTLAATAAANPLIFCDWEDWGCEGFTVLATAGQGPMPIFAARVGAPDPVHTMFGGVKSLRLINNSPDIVPEAYISYVYGLQPGDRVGMEMAIYDETPDGPPTVSIWGHWCLNLPGDPHTIAMDAGGVDNPGTEAGWSMVTCYWTVPDLPVGPGLGLVIKVRVGDMPGDRVWIDDLFVGASCHGGCTWVSPCWYSVENETTTWSDVKSLYR